MSKCLFCEIASGHIPAQLVAQTKTLIAFRDINPQAPTHILIVPKEHVESPGEILGEMAVMAKQLAAGEDFRLVVNNGPKAGQTVFHLHMHLLSGRDFTWPPG